LASRQGKRREEKRREDKRREEKEEKDETFNKKVGHIDNRSIKMLVGVDHH